MLKYSIYFSICNYATLEHNNLQLTLAPLIRAVTIKISKSINAPYHIVRAPWRGAGNPGVTKLKDSYSQREVQNMSTCVTLYPLCIDSEYTMKPHTIPYKKLILLT